MTELMERINFLEEHNIRYFITAEDWVSNLVIDLGGQTILVVEYNLKGGEEDSYMVDHPEWEFSTWETYLAQNLFDRVV